MASSDNLAPSLEPWVFRPSLADTWISEAFARDTDALTKALQKSLSSSHMADLAPASVPCFHSVKSEPAPPLSSLSDPESANSKPPRRLNVAPAGKISKRKSRATKRSPTTFITADPSNFRQMVQEVTGVRLGNGQVPVAPVLKPEPQRAANRLQACLPTLDTSAFLLDHHQQQVMGPVVSQVSFGSVSDGAGLDFDVFQSFPTLESWRVM